MQQRGGVDEFHSRGEHVSCRIGLSDCMGCHQRQHRAQTLAAGRDDIAREVRDDGNRAGGAGSENPFDRGKVFSDQCLHTVHHRAGGRFALRFG